MNLKDQLAEVDRLIDWYEKFKPQPGRVVPVDVAPEQMHKMLSISGKEDVKREYHYRGVILKAVGKPKVTIKKVAQA